MRFLHVSSCCVLLVSCRVLKRPLTHGAAGQGTLYVVEVAGIEPASSGFLMGLLRAQPVKDCRDGHRDRRRWPSVSD
jgi:hypothetical protein